MKNRLIILTAILILLSMVNFAFADRDWEYWNQESFSVPLSKKINFLVLPEWRFKNDMSEQYLFKLETGPSLKGASKWAYANVLVSNVNIKF